MNEFTSSPYDWIRQYPQALKELDEVPLWGDSPSFPWALFSQELERALKLGSCEISALDVMWRESSEIAERIHEEPFSLVFSLNPLKGNSYLLFAHSEIEKLLRVLLQTKENIHLLEKDFIHGFTQFLGLEIADAFQKTGYDKSFVPQILHQSELPQEPCLCIDIAAKINGDEVHGMLCISNEMRSSIKQYYAKKNTALHPSLYNKLEITLQLVAGATTISKKEWHASMPGDVIILDSCSLEPGSDKGRIMLTLNDLPIFRGKIKEGSIKILEYPLFHEVQTPMSPKDYDDEESDYDEESDLDTDFDEESEEYSEEHDEDEYSDDDHYTEDEDYDYEEEEEEETSEIEDKSPPPITPSPAKESASAAPKPAPKQAPINPEEIPLTISIEVGRLQMTIQKLTELQPGNLLELDIHPENGVDLVVNGKCIGKGELLRVGDVLGVRILDKV